MIGWEEEFTHIFSVSSLNVGSFGQINELIGIIILV